MARSVRQQVESLRKQIERHDYLYYVDAAPEISDRAYDRLMERLLKLEREHPQLVTLDSPTQRVGGEPIKGFGHVRHAVPMLSIDNTYNEKDVRAFDARVRRWLKRAEPRYIVEQKIDGVSVTLLYEKGRLKFGATRGDGQRGDDITHNVRTIHDVPLRLQTQRGHVPKALEVRGEVYLTNPELSRLNKLQEEHGQRLFANPRNAAAGTLKLHDPRQCAERRLRFFAHNEGQLEGLKPKNHSDFLELVGEFGIPVVPHSKVFDSIDGVLDYCNEQLEARHEFDYEMDGLVIKVDDFEQRESLGATGKSPRWAIAYKVELWQDSTRLEDIYVQVGKTGTLTPVGRLKPVKIAGSTISRVSLHNADEIARKDIHIGDHVIVEKAGKVIPHVVRVELEKRRRVRKFRFPTKCPACGGKVARDEGGAYIRCQNSACPAQLKERVRFFAARNAMNMAGLGPALIDQLVDQRLVESLPDLYRLSADQLQQVEHFGQRSAQKLLDEIEASKDRGLGRLLTGLGIRHIGDRTARILADEFGSLDALTKASEEKIAGIAGVGSVAAHSVHAFFHSEDGRKTVKELRDLGVTLTEKKAAAKRRGKLTGKTVVVTGTLEQFSREEAEDFIHDHGGKPSSNVSRQTDFVVAGSESGTKLDKAKQLGVRVLNEKQFLKLAGRTA